MIKKVLPNKNFPNRYFAIVAVFCLVAFLLTLKPVAEVVKKGAEMLGINFPALEIFQNTASYLLLAGVGALLLPIAALIPILIVKVSVVIVGLALVAYGLYAAFGLLTGRPVKNILPEMYPKGPKD